MLLVPPYVAAIRYCKPSQLAVLADPGGQCLAGLGSESAIVVKAAAAARCFAKLQHSAPSTSILREQCPGAKKQMIPIVLHLEPLFPVYVWYMPGIYNVYVESL
jgi:hypothetical protein